MADNKQSVGQIVHDGAGGEGAVMFKGWLVPNKDPETGGRLYTDPQFMEWLEIPKGTLLHHVSASDVSASADPNALEQMTVIWVGRERRITKCKSGRAYEFPETEHDPTVRWPRP